MPLSKGTCSMACATPSTCASVPRIPATEKPTGASPGTRHLVRVRARVRVTVRVRVRVRVRL